MCRFSIIKLLLCSLACLSLMACQGHREQHPQDPYQSEQSPANQANKPMTNDKSTFNSEAMRGPLNP